MHKGNLHLGLQTLHKCLQWPRCKGRREDRPGKMEKDRHCAAHSPSTGPATLQSLVDGFHKTTGRMFQSGKAKTQICMWKLQTFFKALTTNKIQHTCLVRLLVGRKRTFISVSQHQRCVSSLLGRWVAHPGHTSQDKALLCTEKFHVSVALKTQSWPGVPGSEAIPFWLQN